MAIAGGFDIGRFKVVDLLGSGGFASVYRAQDTELGREIALKVLHPHLAVKAAVVTRFRAEARAYARLQHPNIVTIYEVGSTDDGRTYLVMPLVEGASLAQLLELEPPPQIERSVAIVAQLALALDYMHEAQLAHRDVKPANIMIGHNDAVTLMDLGIARDLEAQANLTLTGEMVGSPAYMAPEQIDGESVGPAADIYALGIVTYELLVGRPPFTGSASEIIEQQRYQRPPPLAQFNPSLNPALARVVEQALAKQPERRPSSAGAFAADLVACLGTTAPVTGVGNAAVGEVGGSGKSTAAAAAPKLPRRRLQFLGALMAMLLLAVSVASVAALLRRHAVLAPGQRPSAGASHLPTAPSPPALEALPKVISITVDDSASQARAGEVRQDLETIFARFDKEYDFTPQKPMTVRLNSDEPAMRQAMRASGEGPTNVNDFFQGKRAFDVRTLPDGLAVFVFLPNATDLPGNLAELVANYRIQSAGGYDKADSYPYWFMRGFQRYTRTQFSSINSQLPTAVADQKAGAAPALETIASRADAQGFLAGQSSSTRNSSASLDGRGQAAVAFIAEKYGVAAVVRLLKENEFGSLLQFDGLLQTITGMPPDAFDHAVGDWLRQMPAPAAGTATVLASDTFCDKDRTILTPVLQPQQWTMTFLDCEYQIQKLDPNSGGTGIALAGPALDDVTVSVDARLDGPASPAASLGIGCRYRAAGSGYTGYRFFLGPPAGTWTLFRENGAGNNTALDGSTLNGSSTSSGTYRIELTCSGGTITAKVNNVQLASVHDGSFTTGQAFIYGRISQDSVGRPRAFGPVDARFKNLVLTRP